MHNLYFECTVKLHLIQCTKNKYTICTIYRWVNNHLRERFFGSQSQDAHFFRFVLRIMRLQKEKHIPISESEKVPFSSSQCENRSALGQYLFGPEHILKYWSEQLNFHFEIKNGIFLSREIGMCISNIFLYLIVRVIMRNVWCVEFLNTRTKVGEEVCISKKKPSFLRIMRKIDSFYLVGKRHTRS